MFNRKAFAKKRKAQEEQQEKQNQRRQIAEASNVAPEGISNRTQRKALVTKKPQFASAGIAATASTFNNKQHQQQNENDDNANDDDTKSLALSATNMSTATSNVANRLATLLDAPADGSAFMALSSKVSNEERSLSTAKKMSAKRRTRLEIAEFKNETDGDDDDDDDEDEDEDEIGKNKRYNKNKNILEIVDDVGPVAPAKRKQLQQQQNKNNIKQQQQQQQQRVEVDSDDEEGDFGDDLSSNHDGEDKAADEGMKLLKTALRNQNHKKLLPHQDRPDYEYRLRRIATSGSVRLFNALAHAQSAGAQAQQDAEKTMTQDKAESHKIVASREAFMSALRGAASSSRK